MEPEEKEGYRKNWTPLEERARFIIEMALANQIGLRQAERESGVSRWTILRFLQKQRGISSWNLGMLLSVLTELFSLSEPACLPTESPAPLPDATDRERASRPTPTPRSSGETGQTEEIQLIYEQCLSQPNQPTTP